MTDDERLTATQERDLVIATEAGDPDACGRLVDAFLPSIAALACHFPTGVGVQRQELLQEGVAGLLCAARRYNCALNTPFWAYASFWVRKAMQELVAELVRPVALSDRAVRGLAAIRRARNDHLQHHGDEPKTAELARTTGLSREQVEMLQTADRVPHSLQEQPRGDRDATRTFGESIVDPLAEQAYDQVLNMIEACQVRDLVDRLDERERMVIRAHYGLGEPVQTLSQVGGALGTTAERARQIEAAALHKLRDALARPAHPSMG